MNDIFHNNLFWLLFGIAIGSSYVMGTQFVKAWVDRTFFKKGPHHVEL